MNIDMIPDEQIARAKSVDVADLASGYSELRKHSTNELCGPCPLCGGHDRFVAHPDWFLCRQCHAKKGDAIELVQWVDSCGFREAVSRLTGDVLPTGQTIVRRAKPTKKGGGDYDYRSEKWQLKNRKNVLSMVDDLQIAESAEIGRNYLYGRGISHNTWSTYELGFNASVTLPKHPDKLKVPAISIPWRASGTLRGIRYRFLKHHTYTDENGKPRNIKQSAEFGSRFGGVLYGGAGFDNGVIVSPELLALSTLLILEGEINAASCQQVQNNSRLDVVSIGSETAGLTAPMIAHASKYRTVIVWADREDVANGLREEITHAHAIKSPNGLDANDLLQAEMLDGFLSMVRLDACADDDQREALMWDLWDCAKFRSGGIGSKTAGIVRDLATEFGRQAALVEIGNGAWTA